MVVGYYREIYCALDIDEAEIIHYLIDHLKYSNIKELGMENERETWKFL